MTVQSAYMPTALQKWMLLQYTEHRTGAVDSKTTMHRIDRAVQHSKAPLQRPDVTLVQRRPLLNNWR